VRGFTKVDDNNKRRKARNLGVISIITSIRQRAFERLHGQACRLPLRDLHSSVGDHLHLVRVEETKLYFSLDLALASNL
jgi:hypothetical protein